jgi:hypothetical protein
MKLPRRQFLHLVAGATFPVISRVASAQQSYPVPPLRQLAGKWGLVLATNGEAKLRVFTAGEGPTKAPLSLSQWRSDYCLLVSASSFRSRAVMAKAPGHLTA